MQAVKILLFIVITDLTFHSCDSSSTIQFDNTGLYNSKEFKDYWYAGKAEVNSYELDQSRYGESRSGKAMLIFVTEGFSKSEQVKLDDPDVAGDDKVSVMKLNYTKNFVTGIYPYSMMLSSFTPISRNQYPHTLKVSMTSQEWCGQVFSQMNFRKNKYEVESYSYFEKEGDVKFTTDNVLLEDELFSMLRIDPDHIPMGKISILPGLFFTRLNHQNLKPVTAEVTKINLNLTTRYTIQYPNRALQIEVDKDFPHRILNWEEEFKEGDRKVITRATLSKTLYIDYWRKNKNENLSLRDSLGLSQTNY